MGLASGYETWIVTVGNEILIGRIVNTNASWLGRKLTLLGYKVRRCLVVADDLEDIAWAFRTALKSGARVTVSTGGLGPTFDDKTVEGLALSLNRKLVVDERALSMIREKYARRGLALTESRIKMARIPEGSRPIPNPVGTAPGVHVVEGGGHIFALPGVPPEMKAMFEAYVEPLLRDMGPKLFFAEKSFRAVGVPESEAAPLIERAMKLEDSIYIKSHPRGAELDKPVLEFHITSSATVREEAEKAVNRVYLELRRMLRERGAAVEEP